jgi:hypothetical protein
MNFKNIIGILTYGQKHCLPFLLEAHEKYVLKQEHSPPNKTSKVEIGSNNAKIQDDPQMRHVSWELSSHKIHVALPGPSFS